MLLPRIDPTQSTLSATAAPTPTSSSAPTASAISHSSTYNVVSFIIAGFATSIGLTLFYFLYWRKRPSRPAPRLVVSRTGVVRVVTGNAIDPRERQRNERQRIIEQAQRERDERDWGVQRAEQRGLPKYSRALEGQAEPSMGQVDVQAPPPAYDPTSVRIPSRTCTR